MSLDKKTLSPKRTIQERPLSLVHSMKSLSSSSVRHQSIRESAFLQKTSVCSKWSPWNEMRSRKVIPVC